MVRAKGETMRENGTDVCFIISAVDGTLYIVDRMNRALEFP